MAAKWMVPAVVLVLALSGCTSEAKPTTDEGYLKALRITEPALEDVPDEELIGLGHQICDMFDDQGFDQGMDNLVSYIDGTGITEEGAGVLAGSAVSAYCPEYSDNF